MLLVRIRATGAVKSTPDEVTCSPSQLQRLTDLPTSAEPFSPHAATAVAAVLWCSFPFKVHTEVHASLVLILLTLLASD